MKFTDEVYKTVPRENGEVILFEMDHGLSGWPLNWSLKAVWILGWDQDRQMGEAKWLGIGRWRASESKTNQVSC